MKMRDGDELTLEENEYAVDVDRATTRYDVGAAGY